MICPDNDSGMEASSNMFMLKSNELEQVRAAVREDGKLERLWTNLLNRLQRQIKRPGLVQEDDTVEWWHLAWERIGDAAFVYAVERHTAAGEWLRGVVLDIVNKAGPEWHGPWFRARSVPQHGVLETAHVGLALSEAYGLCGDLFTAEERTRILQALREHCQEPCKRALDAFAGGKGHINNWFMVLLNGYGTVSMLLDDRPAVQQALTFYQIAVRMYNKDSYGESLQYWDYATRHLSHLNELFVRYDSAMAEQAERVCYVRCIPWVVQSFLYMKPLEGPTNHAFPRSLNFGDSAAIYRPSGDVLLHVASRARNEAPVEAGLARWLFEETYSVLEIERNELGTFAFVSTYRFMSIIYYLNAAEPLSPEEARLPKLAAFENGNVIMRDGRGKENTVIGMQAGYEPLQVTSHNHRDQGSFILTHRHERFFIDPGHTCYRLETQKISTATNSHSTWTFKTEGSDEILVQKSVEGANFRNWRKPIAHRKLVEETDGIVVVRTELADAYGKPIRKAERTWIMALPNILFIVDRIEADRSIKTRAGFMVNNRDNKLQANLYSDTRIVLRRGEAAMKFFLMDSFADGQSSTCGRHVSWGYMHQHYHPQPNRHGQGKEGSAIRYTYESGVYAREHVMVYAFAMDGLDRIKGWHINRNDDGHYYAEPPEQTGGLAIGLDGQGGLLIANNRTGRVYEVDDDGVQPVRNE
jgi:hypothetical protein